MRIRIQMQASAPAFRSCVSLACGRAFLVALSVPLLTCGPAHSDAGEGACVSVLCFACVWTCLSCCVECALTNVRASAFRCQARAAAFQPCVSLACGRAFLVALSVPLLTCGLPHSECRY
jgi:hypothetical protein